jgi:hypothetical protein
MFNPVVRKNIEEMIEQDKNASNGEANFRATIPAVRVSSAEIDHAMAQ